MVKCWQFLCWAIVFFIIYLAHPPPPSQFFQPTISAETHTIGHLFYLFLLKICKVQQHIVQSNCLYSTSNIYTSVHSHLTQIRQSSTSENPSKSDSSLLLWKRAASARGRSSADLAEAGGGTSLGSGASTMLALIKPSMMAVSRTAFQASKTHWQTVL